MAAELFAETARVTPAREVRATAFGHETVILDLRAGVYFGLDAVGTHIWDLIAGGATVGEIRDAVLAAYDVERRTCETDLQKLLRDLAKRRLIEVSDAPA